MNDNKGKGEEDNIKPKDEIAQERQPEGDSAENATLSEEELKSIQDFTLAAALA
eukprot:CAMPEP_0194375144 /NCGR_PEP_ID=MMETSP0174-20130528/23613_1 /TAXON_ID=216777 /ORGANISM="Proboscia alata, Strain PI-D3" /LENGTH=53 /DNA_ID=CAMNT_0039155145 /DNA_START=205 /DNA_END=363 /DNA_ORIENTATION=+